MLEDPLDCLRVISEGKRDFYGVVSFPHRAFSSRAMTFVSDKIALVPGHVLLVSITPESWKKDENNFMFQVSEIAMDAEMISIRSPIRRDYKPV